MPKPKKVNAEQRPMSEKEIRLQGLVAIAEGDYWGRTDGIVADGRTPTHCGEAMVAEDDHGRFVCFKCGARAAL